MLDEEINHWSEERMKQLISKVSTGMNELIQELKQSTASAKEADEIIKAEVEEKVVLREKLQKEEEEGKVTKGKLIEKVQMVSHLKESNKCLQEENDKLNQKLAESEEIIKNKEEEQKVTKEKVFSLINSKKLLREEKEKLVVSQTELSLKLFQTEEIIKAEKEKNLTLRETLEEKVEELKFSKEQLLEKIQMISNVNKSISLLHKEKNNLSQKLFNTEEIIDRLLADRDNMTASENELAEKRLNQRQSSNSSSRRTHNENSDLRLQIRAERDIDLRTRLTPVGAPEMVSDLSDLNDSLNDLDRLSSERDNMAASETELTENRLNLKQSFNSSSRRMQNKNSDLRLQIQAERDSDLNDLDRFSPDGDDMTASETEHAEKRLNRGQNSSRRIQNKNSDLRQQLLSERDIDLRKKLTPGGAPRGHTPRGCGRSPLRSTSSSDSSRVSQSDSDFEAPSRERGAKRRESDRERGGRRLHKSRFKPRPRSNKHGRDRRRNSPRRTPYSRNKSQESPLRGIFGSQIFG